MTLFVSVAEAGSFVKAAEALGISAPAVTRALAALERYLGCRLLHRTTRRVSLTEAGRRYLDDCRRILQELKEAEEAVGGSQAAPQGEVQLTAPVLFGQLFVMPALREFLDSYPGVVARVLFLDRVVNLVEEGHDLAVRIGELADSSLYARRVGEVRRVVCGAPGYFGEHGVPQTPADLRDHRLIATGEGRLTEWRLPRPWRLSPRLVVNSNQAALDAALAGWGVTRLLSYQVAAAVEAGDLQIALAEFEPTPWPIHVVHQEGRRMSLKVRLLLDHLTERLTQHPLLGL